MRRAPDFPTYLITGGNARPHTFSTDKKTILQLIERSAGYGISMVQLREKLLTARQVFELAREASSLLKNSGTKLLVNDRADIALAAGASGVHLTAHSLPAEIIRQSFPAGFLLGVSAHSLETAVSAKEQGADFITFSPVFETLSKAGYGPPQGVEKLAAVVKAVAGLPVFALGGIDGANHRETLDVGAAGVAGIGWLNELVMAN